MGVHSSAAIALAGTCTTRHKSSGIQDLADPIFLPRQCAFVFLDYLDSYVFAFVVLKNPSFAVSPPNRGARR
jgi:hypothetical protein